MTLIFAKLNRYTNTLKKYKKNVSQSRLDFEKCNFKIPKAKTYQIIVVVRDVRINQRIVIHCAHTTLTL